MASLIATTPSMNEKNGNGRYRGLRRRKKQGKSASQGYGSDFNYLANTDLTMKFNKSQDPIYFAFETIENKSVPELMNEFIKDSFFEITNFVSKVIK